MRDAIHALYSAGVCGNVYRLWYQLNKNTTIAVQTGAGLTDMRNTGEKMGQVTVGGALASALNLYEEVNAHFEESPAEICNGPVRIQPQSHSKMTFLGVVAVEMMHNKDMIDSKMSSKANS